MDTTAERIFNLLDNSGMEQKAFATAIGATDKIVSKWRTSGLMSYRKYLSQIAEVLGTSVEYLLTGTEKKSATAGQIRKEDLQAAFWGGEKDLSPEDMDAMWGDVERFAQFVAEKKRQEKKNRD